MEIAVLWFLSMVALNTEIEKNKADITELQVEVVLNQKWISDLEKWNSDLETTAIKQAAAHSAFYAGQQSKNDAAQDDIELLESRIEVLEMKKPSEQKLAVDIAKDVL